MDIPIIIIILKTYRIDMIITYSADKPTIHILYGLLLLIFPKFPLPAKIAH